MPDNMSSGIVIDKVSFAYQKDSFVIKNLSCRIRRGIFLGVAGKNGSGKSTFSYLLNSLIPNSINGKFQGQVYVDGISTRKKNISYFARRVGMVFQNPEFSLFNLTVKEEIEFGLKNFNIKFDDKKIIEVLKKVNMQNFIDRDPQSLSFGEKQKISLACVLALDTDYIVLDEPVAQLDWISSVEFYQILKKINKLGKTIIVIEHNTDFLYRYTDDVFIFKDGVLYKKGMSKKILKESKEIELLGLKPVR